MKFRSNILSYTLIPLFILLVGSSYFRFIVVNDYMVGYESDCDPVTSVCFIGCENDECTEVHYYKKIHKYAPNLLNQCGEDITGCENANTCLKQKDDRCSIIYCDEKVSGDECETISEKSSVQNLIQTESTIDSNPTDL